MELNETDALSSNSSINTDTFPPRSVCFALILAFDIPSLACSLFLLHHFLSKRILRHGLNNHMVIVLLCVGLIIQLIDMPLYLNYYRLGFVWPQTSIICVIWWYIDITFFDIFAILVAWASFERHLLVFHNKLMSTRKKRWLFHYIPMIFFITYSLSFYLLVLFIPSCNNEYIFDYTYVWCNFSPCYYNNNILSMYDTLANAALPCLLTGFFSMTLLVRVIWLKNIHLRQRLQWRRYRKMTMQLFCVSGLFLIFNVPLLIYYLMQTCGSLPSNINPEIFAYFFFLANFSVLFYPFVILSSLSLKYWWKKWFNTTIYLHWRRHRATIAPQIIAISNVMGQQVIHNR